MGQREIQVNLTWGRAAAIAYRNTPQWGTVGSADESVIRPKPLKIGGDKGGQRQHFEGAVEICVISSPSLGEGFRVRAQR